MNFAPDTYKYFQFRLREVDSFCSVMQHPTIKFCIRVIPSEPRLAEVLRDRVEQIRPAGVLVSVMRLTDDFGYPETRKLTWTERLRGWITL